MSHPDYTRYVVVGCIIGLALCIIIAALLGGNADRRRKLAEAAQTLCPHGVLSVRLDRTNEPVIECAQASFGMDGAHIDQPNFGRPSLGTGAR